MPTDIQQIILYSTLLSMLYSESVAAVILKNQIKDPPPKVVDLYQAMKNKSIAQFIHILKTQVGVTEHGGNNRGKDVNKYQRATTLGGTGWPWCAAFVSWAMKELNILTPAKLPKTAAVAGLTTWAKKHGAPIIKPSKLAKAGDIIIFRFSHTGVVAKDQKQGENYVHTIEGNTNKAGSREGDGVYEKLRPISDIKHYIRWIHIV